MAINPYIDSANIFIYPCANRKEGFWESKLTTEYSLRTLIPWKITKPSFVITGDTTASNLEFVINGYYFNIKSNWRTTINPTSGQPLWAHIRLANKPLTSTAEGETTTILVNYEDGSQILDEETSPNYTFKGVRFDSGAGTEATNYYHLQILDEAGNFLHRDMIKINCDDPLEQDDETGLLSLKYGNGLTLNNNTLITKLGNGLEFGSGTDREKPIQIKLATNSGLTRDTNGLKVINAVSDPIAANNILQSLKINNVTYTIPQGKTYTAGNGIQINSNNIISAKTDSAFGIETIDTGSKIILADGSYTIGAEEKTVYSGLQFAVCTSNGESYKGLQIKLADSSLQTDSNGLAVKLETNSGLGKSSGLYVQLQSSGGLQKNSNGLGIKLPTKSGLETTTNGLQIKVNTASGLVLTSDGLKMKYPLPSIDGNDKKILAVTSDGTSLEWVEKPSGGGGTYSAGSGISINSNNAISVSLATNSGLEFSDSKLRLKKSNGINIDSNGVFIKLKSNSGLTCDTNGLAINNATIGLATANSSPKPVKVLLKQAGLEKWKTVGQYYISTITSSNRLEHTVNVNLWPCPWNETYQATGSHFVLAGETYEPNYASLGNVSWDGVYIIPERTEAIVPSMVLPGFHIATDTDPVSYQDLTSIDIGKIATLKFTYQTWE